MREGMIKEGGGVGKESEIFQEGEETGIVVSGMSEELGKLGWEG